jgi:hypothetical protein
MYAEILRGILFEHASVYRAVTVEEYRARIVSRASHEAEYARLYELYSRALRSVDPYLMTLTVEIYEYLAVLGILSAEYSEWELELEEGDGNIPYRQPSHERP